MKRKDVQLLLIVLGILIAVCSWQFIYNPNVEKTDTLEAENATLKEIVAKLEELDAKRATYETETENMHNEALDIIDRFPSDFLTEDEIMYLYNMENVPQNQVVIPNIGLGTQSEVPYAGNLTVDEYELTDEGIKMMTAQNTITFTTTYTGLKNVIGYIYDMPGRKSVSSISLSAGADGYLGGTMSVDFYALTGTEKLYVPIDIIGVPTGKSNIFGTLDENGNNH